MFGLKVCSRFLVRTFVWKDCYSSKSRRHNSKEVCQIGKPGTGSGRNVVLMIVIGRCIVLLKLDETTGVNKEGPQDLNRSILFRVIGISK